KQNDDHGDARPFHVVDGPNILRRKPQAARSPDISTYGVSPMTAITSDAPSAPVPSLENVTSVFLEAAFRIAARIVVPPGVTLPLFPCHVIVHPPHWFPRSSALLPPT